MGMETFYGTYVTPPLPRLLYMPFSFESFLSLYFSLIIKKVSFLPLYLTSHYMLYLLIYILQHGPHLGNDLLFYF